MYTSNLLVMILIDISCEYIGSVHSMTLKFSDVNESEEEEDFEEEDKEKESTDESEEHI